MGAELCGFPAAIVSAVLCVRLQRDTHSGHLEILLASAADSAETRKEIW